MLVQPALTDEPARLYALQRLGVLDTPREEAFDDVVKLVRSVLNVPISAVSLIDKDRQWFKAIDGLDATETPRSEAFCDYAIRQSAPLVIPDATLDPRVANYPAVTGDPHVRAYAGVPLVTSDGYSVGALCAVDTRTRDFTDEELDLLRNFARIVVTEMELRRIAERDQLTGLLTRRGFIAKVNQEIARCHRYGRDASLVLVDVDHFKTVNDAWGHPAGDTVLRDLAATLSAAGRSADILGRLGGEEFALLLPETGIADGLAAGERLRQAIASRPVVVSPAQTIAVTASFGIASFDSSITVAEEWIARADVPLYRAKRGGRNRCVVG